MSPRVGVQARRDRIATAPKRPEKRHRPEIGAGSDLEHMRRTAPTHGRDKRDTIVLFGEFQS